MPPKSKRTATRANVAQNPSHEGGTSSAAVLETPNKRTRRGLQVDTDNSTTTSVIPAIKLPQFVSFLTNQKDEVVRGKEVTKDEIFDAMTSIKLLAEIIIAADPQSSEKNGKDIVGHLNKVFELIDDESSPVDDEDEQITDEICVIGGKSMSEREIKCPYSLKVMVNPLKNNHPRASCIHHVEKETFVSLVKRTANMTTAGAVKCPCQGCNGQWDPRYVIEDIEFAKKIQEFMRKQKKTQTKPTVVPDVIDLT